MRRFFLGLFATVGVLAVLLVLLVGGLVAWRVSHGPTVHDDTILTLDLTHAFPDGPPPSGGLRSLVVPSERPLRSVLDGIERAGDDPRVKGLVAQIGDGDFGLAEVQELRDAIAGFRAKGKPAIAFSDSFGALGSGTRSYYLATAFNEIWLQPTGLLGLTGLRAETPFIRGLLDKLGIVPRFDHREQYKTAMNTLTDTAMTPAQTEETNALLASDFGQIVAGIAAGRKLDPAVVRALIDRGPLLTDEALQAHLVDHIGYRDEAEAALKQRLGGKARLMPLGRYLAGAGRPHRSGPTIALIYADGLITEGGASGPLSGAGVLSAEKLIRAFHSAARDPHVRAILFRIDSPGGSAVASEAIWRATVQAKAAGKPLIVSMGDVAGSGGYYIAAAADKIVAEPATLTASIGVLAGKLLVKGLSDKLGVTWGAAQLGANADIESSIADFSPAEQARFEAFLDATYAAFKDRVAAGRRLSPAAVEAVAKGRVWTGAEAKKRGLVDVLGGYATALDLAKQAAHLASDRDVTLKLFPPERSTVETLFDRATGREPDEQGAGAVLRMAAFVAPLLARIELLTRAPGAALMTAPEIR